MDNPILERYISILEKRKKKEKKIETKNEELSVCNSMYEAIFGRRN